MEQQNVRNPSTSNFNDLPKKGSSKCRFFTDHFYLSHPEVAKNKFPAPNLLQSLKNVSVAGLEAELNSKLNTCIRFSDFNKTQKPIVDLNKDSFTQTSKTILQLAQLENGEMTPDSLSNSPKEIHNEFRSNEQKLITEEDPPYTEEEVKDGLENKVEKDTCQKLDINLTIMEEADKRESSEEIMELPASDSLTFMRKGQIDRYFRDLPEAADVESICEEEAIDLDKKTFSLTERFLAKKNSSNPSNMNVSSSSEFRSKFLQQTSPLRNLLTTSTVELVQSAPTQKDLRSQSFVESYIPNYINEEIQQQPENPRLQASRFTIKQVREHILPERQSNLRSFTHTRQEGSQSRNSSPGGAGAKRNFAFMAPTLASERKSRLPEVQTACNLISPPRRGRAFSIEKMASEVVEKIHNSSLLTVPYIDQMADPTPSNRSENRKSSTKKFYPTKNFDGSRELEGKRSQVSIISPDRNFDATSESSLDHAISTAVSRLRDRDWATALRGLAELTELCRSIEPDVLYPQMVNINQRLIELLRSPRSHVCRTACQAAGYFFEFMKDTRRPEFDDIVNILLLKTADTNKFIKRDANLALDCMVTHIPTVHAIRILCAKGPDHKNALVRVATIRLVVCAVVIAGPSVILNTIANEGTRKRIYICLRKFLKDRCLEARKYGERLYKVLKKETNFDFYLKKYFDKDEVKEIKSAVKTFNNKR